MKIFQSIQKHFASLGVNEAEHQHNKFNMRSVVGLIVVWQFSILTNAFLIFEADSFGDLADAFYVSSTVLGASVNHSFVVNNMDKLFTFIGNLEQIIETREFGIF